MARKQHKPSPLRDKVLKLLRKSPDKQRTIKSISKQINFKGRSSTIRRILDELEKEQLVRQIARGKYVAGGKPTKRSKVKQDRTYRGLVDLTRSGAGYILVDGLEDDVFVPAKHLRGAMNKDRVEITIDASVRRGRLSGRVVSIVERHLTEVVARVHTITKLAYCEPIHDIGIYEITVHPDDLGEATLDDIVLLRIIDWPARKQTAPRAEVLEIISDYPQHQLGEYAILTKYGFSPSFSPEAQADAQRIHAQGTVDSAPREDFREVLTFTIDPADAKDYDDAISYRPLDGGHAEVGIHIADVTHYLQAESALDKEARRRSTSVYLVGHVCPMLPEVLSNDLCSLVQGEDRLTFSVIFDIDEKNTILSGRIAKTIIHSDHRLAYEEGQAILEDAEHDLHDVLSRVKQFTDRLRKRRNQAGAINFETDEVRFLLDEKKHPTDIYIKERKPIHLMIEDLMLEANRFVATTITEKAHGRMPLPYRVHDEPNMEKIIDLSYMAKMLGFDFQLSNIKTIRSSFNRLHKAARVNDAYKVLERLGIRCMAKAVYTPDNIGHFGLAFDHYVHFTSPIRRYADVLTHRIAFAYIQGQKSPYDKGRLMRSCNHISRQERMALDAERESIKLKQAEYLLHHVGKTFNGEVSGIIERGIFVALDGGIGEGFIPFDRLDEPYKLHPSGYSATGQFTKQLIAFGDKVKVAIVEVDLDSRRIDLEMVEENDD